MPRILVNNDWFEPIETASLYEKEFEAILLQRSAQIFPGFLAVPFKRTIQADFDSARPDYALIAGNYGDWWVVEVEMGHHSLVGHVLPQVQTLANGTYNDEIVDYLVSKNDRLDREKVRDLVRGRSPRVLVVVDRPCLEWAPHLARYGAELAVFEIFRSKFNKHVFRLNGFVPKLESKVVSRCYLDRTIPFLICLESPGAISFRDDGTVDIVFDDRLMCFSRLDTANATWLSPVQRNPLERGRQYEIVSNEDGSLAFRLA